MEGATTPPLTLRPATADDAEAIAEVWHRAWNDGHAGRVPEALLPHRTLDHFRRRVAERIPSTTVAVLHARVVGFVTVRDDELNQLFVAAAARGTGVAAALLRHAEGVIGLRAGVAWLAVADGNARARRFYEREGWRDVAAIDYRADIEGGSIPVPCRRYERVLRGG